jgi:hypothetical protein
MDARYTRIWTDADGETHFGEGADGLDVAEFAPPAPPMDVSAPRPAAAVRFIGAPAGWDSDPHPAPRRQFVVMLRGVVEAGTSDGEVRRFGPGAAVLLEDLDGKGHRTRVPGDEDWLAMVVVLD